MPWNSGSYFLKVTQVMTWLSELIAMPRRVFRGRGLRFYKISTHGVPWSWRFPARSPIPQQDVLAKLDVLSPIRLRNPQSGWRISAIRNAASRTHGPDGFHGSVKTDIRVHWYSWKMIPYKIMYTINMHTTVYQFWRLVYHHEQSVIDHYARI